MAYSNFLQQLLNDSRLLYVLHDNLPPKIKDSQLYQHIAQYLQKYADFNNINAAEATKIYSKYISAYNKHCKLFIISGKYPAQAADNNFFLSRVEYDIVLLLSTLFTPHRFRIMQLLIDKTNPAQKALYIGLGSGLEIELTKKSYNEIHGFDLSVNNFLFSHFHGIKLNMELYAGQQEDYFDSIYIIELLEHLEDPYALIDVCQKSLIKGGKIYLTTATDIPQFDHLYNFPADHKGFEERLKQSGFSILYKEKILHDYLSIDLKPSNHFYIIEKV